MKIDFTSPILDLAGEQTIENDKPLTLSTLAVTALLTTLAEPNGQPERLPPVEAVRNATLAQAIFTTPSALDLTAEQVAILKDRIGRCYSPLAVMRAWELLDPPA